MKAVLEVHKNENRNRIIIMVCGGALLLGLIGWGISTMMGGKAHKPKQATKAFLVPDKPPPPPPKEEKKIEPPKTETKEVKINTPKEQAPVTQNEPLKMEGAAGDGNSPFGAGTVGREYSGGSFGGSLYAGQLQRHLQIELNKNRKLRESDYRVTLRVWVAKDGAIQRAELAQSTGNEALDELLRQSLLQVAAMRDLPPEGTPQPIRIRVTARGTS